LIPNFGTLGGFKLKLPLILMRGSFILGVGKVILNIFFMAFIPLLIALFAFSIPLLNLLTMLFKTLLTIFSTDLKSPLNIEVIKDIYFLTILLIEFNFDVNKVNIEDKIFKTIFNICFNPLFQITLIKLIVVDIMLPIADITLDIIDFILLNT